MKWLWKNKIHLLIWAVFAVYLLSANQLYATFFLKNGKPIKGSLALPTETGEIKFFFDKLDTIYYDGQELYELVGWGFDPANADSPQYQKKIVLHSTSENLIFPAKTSIRTDLSTAMPLYPMNLEKAGFRVLIAKDALKISNYRLGILLENDQGKVESFRLLNAYIEREPNRLRLIFSH